MHTIAMKISGDDAVANHEDNYADLCIAALESIEGFEKKTGQTFDEAIDDKLFDQYTKTVLWNRKAKKGIPLTKRMDFRNRHVSLDRDLDSGDVATRVAHELIPDNKASYGVSAFELEDFTESQPENVKKVINAIVKNPSILSKDGVFNHSVIRKATGLSVHYTSKAVDHLKEALRKTYEI